MYTIVYDTKPDVVRIIIARQDENGNKTEAWWLDLVEYTPYVYCAYKPNIIEKKLGTTWEQKIASAEKKALRVVKCLNKNEQYLSDCHDLAREALRQYAIKKLGDEFYVKEQKESN